MHVTIEHLPCLDHTMAMQQFNNANVETVWSYIRLDLENKKDEVKNSEKIRLVPFFFIFTYLLIDLSSLQSYLHTGIFIVHF